jgi:hypothetical protein
MLGSKKIRRLRIVKLGITYLLGLGHKLANSSTDGLRCEHLVFLRGKIQIRKYGMGCFVALYEASDSRHSQLRHLFQ